MMKIIIDQYIYLPVSAEKRTQNIGEDPQPIVRLSAVVWDYVDPAIWAVSYGILLSFTMNSGLV